MHKLSAFVAFALCLLSLGSLSMVFGQMMSSAVGVNRGDVFSYSYTCYFNSNDSSTVPPASFSWINQTDYFMVNVTDVSGSVVSLGTVMRGLNGSDSFGVCTLNVESGAAMLSGYVGPAQIGNFLCMSRGVGMMSRMYPSSTNSPIINETRHWDYASGQRLANRVTLTNTSQADLMSQSDYFYDEPTGMMIEWRQQDIQVNGNLKTNSTQMMRLTSSSVWVVPEFPAVLVTTLVTGIFATASAVVITRKHRIAKYAEQK